MLKHLSEARLPTEFGLFTLHLFQFEALEIPVLTQFETAQADLLLRIHSSCLTGDVFSSVRCDCGSQLSLSMQKIQARGGLLIYLPQEGRGIGLMNKMKAYALQDKEKLDTVEANLKLNLPVDARLYDSVKEILLYFKIQKCILLTNNPLKIKALESFGVGVIREALTVLPHLENQKYLAAKAQKLGHLL